MFGKKDSCMAHVIKKEDTGLVYKVSFMSQLETLTFTVNSSVYNSINVGDYGSLVFKKEKFISFYCGFAIN